MNRDIVKDFDFDDPHGNSLRKLWTLYRIDTSGIGNLSQLGYKGYPDPLFKDENGGPFTPDFLAIGEDGDAQIIDVKGFENIEEYLDGRSEVEAKIESVIEDLKKYENISPAMVSDYLSMQNVSYRPDHHELIVLLPHTVYTNYESTVIDVAEAADLRVWVLEENTSEHLWLAYGEHSNQTLTDHIERGAGRGLQVYQGGKDLLPFVRDTDKDIVRFYFVANITAYCGHERKLEFRFDEIDDILVNELRPKMFRHLPKSERADIWKDCINQMRSRFELISRTTAIDDTYEWDRTRFLKQSRDRNRIVESVGEELGVLGDEG